MKSEIVMSVDELPAEVITAIAEGRKVVAIKLLREATGLGLANAKVLVDRAAARMDAENPKARRLQSDSNTARFFGVLVLLTAGYLIYSYVL